MKPYTTELSESLYQISKNIGYPATNMYQRMKTFKNTGLIIPQDDKLYINLNYATRGFEVTQATYRLFPDFPIKKEPTIGAEHAAKPLPTPLDTPPRKIFRKISKTS